MCFPFLSAQGHAVGESLCSQEDTDHATPCARAGGAARARAPRAARRPRHRPPSGRRPPSIARSMESTSRRAGWALTIWPATSERYAREIAAAGTVFWNGPMGAFEQRAVRCRDTCGRRGGRRGERADGRRWRRLGRGAGSLRPRAARRPPLDRRWRHARAGRGKVLPGVRALDGAGVAS